MTEEQLEKLGVYFVYHNIRERFNITFEEFLHLHKAGVNLLA